MVNPQPLFLESGEPAGVWYCDTCRNVKSQEEHARSCCEVKLCPKCDKVMEPYRIARCSDCHRKDQDAKEAKRLEEAELVEYDGKTWLYDIHQRGNDGYFATLDDLIDHLASEECEPEDWPEFVHLCTPSHIKVSISDIFEQLECEGYDEMTEHAEGGNELRAAIDKFNEINHETFTVWYPDTTKKIAVPKEES